MHLIALALYHRDGRPTPASSASAPAPSTSSPESPRPGNPQS